MMNKQRPYLTLLVSMLLILFLAVVQTAEASTTDVTFVIHKRLFSDTKPSPVISSHTWLSDDSPLLKNSTGVNGAVYTVHNVTANYWQLAGKKNNEEIMASLSEMTTLASDNNQVAEVTTSTDVLFGQGVARVTLPEYVMNQGQEKYAVYLFKEQSSPLTNEYKKSGNFIVGLPIEGVTAQEPFIHLYPKSRSMPQVTLTKRLKDSQQNFTYDQPIDYLIETMIPENLVDLRLYQLEDSYDGPLDYLKGSLHIYIDDKEQTSLFTLSENETAGRLTLKTSGELLRAQKITAGSKVRVVYQMFLAHSAVPGVTYDNSVRLTTQFEGGSPPDLEAEAPPVETGGKRFKKVDMENQEKGLSGASFLIKNQEGHYLTSKDDRYTWGDDPVSAYRVVSDETGSFSIKGLADGKYDLMEIKAPDGYKLLKDNLSFTVEQGSYGIGDKLADPLVVVNAQEPKEITTPLKPTEAPKNNLPQMGESHSLVLTTLGIVMIISSRFYTIRRRER